jgi:hypothetical protein
MAESNNGAAARGASGSERVTYCRICEPLCGVVATVEDGRVAKIRMPDYNALVTLEPAGPEADTGVSLS